jgi:hypothetical protein
MDTTWLEWGDRAQIQARNNLYRDIRQQNRALSKFECIPGWPLLW